MSPWMNSEPPCSSFAYWLSGRFFALPSPGLILFFILLVVAILSYKGKQLTLSGTAGEILVGWGITYILGFGALFTILFFFVEAALVGRLARRARTLTVQVDQKKSGPRDIVQVFANGGLSLVFAILWGATRSRFCLIMFAASIAEAAADTTAGDIGVLSGEIPVSILTGRPMPRGMSGAVTQAGFLASLCAALLTALVWQGSFFVPGRTAWLGTAIVTASAFLGAAFDSVLGASCQACYWDEEKQKYTEREKDGRGNPLELRKGLRWMDNDVVNLLSGLVASALAASAAALLRW